MPDPVDEQPEVVIDGDATGSDGAPAPQPRRAGRLMAALTSGALLIFALGMAVGNHLGGSAQPISTPTPSPTEPDTTSPATVASRPGPTSQGPDTTSAHSAEPSRLPEAVTVPGVCDSRVLAVDLTDASLPEPPETTGLRLLAGSYLRPIDIDQGTVGEPTATLVGSTYATSVATGAPGAAGLAFTVAECGNQRPTLARVGPHDHVIRVTNPTKSAGTTENVAGFITAENRTWAVALLRDPDANATAAELIAMDGSGHHVTLPREFRPQAGWQHLIIGSTTNGSMIQIYDLRRGGITDQFGGQQSVQFLAADGAVVWGCSPSPTPSNSGCPVHRYDLASHTDTTVGTTYGPSGRWLAISPDGTKIVTLVRDQPTADDSDSAGDSPATAVAPVTTLRDIDLSTARSTPLPGLPPLRIFPPSVAFSPDGQWIILAVPGKDGGRILLYHASNLHGPYDPGITLPGPLTATIPLAVLEDSAD